MGKQPKLDIPAGKLEKVFNFLSALLLLGSFIYVVQAYESLPETIPTHFNAHGEADGWGSKAIIFLLPCVAVFVCFIPMYFISKVPHTFNCMTEVTEENAPRLYPAGRLFMATINLEIAVIFTYITWEIVQAAKGNFTLGVWIIAAIIAVPLITVIIFMMRLKRLK